jgi:cytoskeletal protein CcmA (bactofilin family)
MTMFTKNDKMPEPSPGAAISASSRSDLPPPANPRPSPSVQPLSHVASPRAHAVSVISKALKITGQLESTEDIQVDGQIDGDVRGVSVKVGAGAMVKGSVYGDDVELSGTVEGKIEAKKVILTGTAHMSGDVIHQEITIQPGAFIDGYCRPGFGKAESGKSSAAHKPAIRGLEIANNPNSKV